MDDKNKTGYLGNNDDATPIPMLPRTTGVLDSNMLPWVIEFRVIGTSDIIKLNLSESLFIGREDKNSSFMPDINLTPYGALALGVSRRHATLVVRDNRITLIDLDSSNGTYINGHVLVSNRPFRIRDGDILRFGKLELAVHFILRPYNTEDTMVGLGNILEISHIASGQRVLLLDDDTYVCAIIGNVLRQAGFSAVVTYKLTDAIKAVDEQTPQALLLEPFLAAENGLDLIYYLKKKFPNQNIPIVIISNAATSYQTGPKIIDIDNHILLTKPISIEDLQATLLKVVKMMGSTV